MGDGADDARDLAELLESKCEFCGAPMRLSKKGNLYCTNICWEKEPYKTAIIESQHSDWGNRD